MLGCTDPTGLFSLTVLCMSKGIRPSLRRKSRTDTQHGCLELRRRHTLQHTRPDLAQIEEAGKLHRALLEFQLGAGRVGHEQIAYSLLLRSRRRGPRRDLRDRGEHELAREVVGVRRVEDGHQKVDELLVGDLGG